MQETHQESHGQIKNINNYVPPDTKKIFKTTHRSFFFGPKRLLQYVPYFLITGLATNSTSFEVLTSFLWRCNTASLKWKNPNQDTHFSCIVNARFGRCKFNPSLPEGFYGNAFMYPAAVTTVEKLLRRPLGYALELVVKKAKNEANEEYVHSVADLMTIKERGCYPRGG